MKTKTKALVLALCAVLLVVTTVFATMAYLTSTDMVINTFTVGNVSIELDEAAVDTAGEKIANAARRDQNTYKLMPGHEYTKDPTVHVAKDSETCWLFVKLENGLNAIIDNTTIEAQMKAKGWTEIDTTNHIYAYEEAVTPDSTNGTDVEVFEKFKLKGDADVAAYANAKIVITAYAVQADGFDTANDAWKATSADLLK